MTRNSASMGIMRALVAGICFYVVVLGVLRTTAAYIDEDESNLGYVPEDLLSEERINNLFSSWQIRHGKSYVDEPEKLHRMKVFKDNLFYIHAHNSKDSSFKMGLNEFSDLTFEEFSDTMLMKKWDEEEEIDLIDRNLSPRIIRYGDDGAMQRGSPAPAIDWRKKGVVNPIRSQGQCGSCWAFSAIAAVESINAIRTGQLYDLSEQELVDCLTYMGCKGCDGGKVDSAFTFIAKDNKGIDSEEDYPYVAQQAASCDIQKRNNRLVTIDDYAYVTKNSSRALMLAVAQQPVVVYMHASKDFKSYASGIYNGNCSGDHLNHAVVVVGYSTTTKGVPYWIVRNSWATTWGESGYVLMKQTGEDNPGVCGMLRFSVYPIKNGTHDSGDGRKDE